MFLYIWNDWMVDVESMKEDTHASILTLPVAGILRVVHIIIVPTITHV